MSHFAEIDQNNIVVRVVVGNNNETDEGYQWLVNNLGGTWIKTSYNNKIRFNFAGIGYSYDEVNDAFIAPKANCHIEEVLDSKTYRWSCSNLEHSLEIPHD